MALISGSQTITTANLTDLLDGGASTLHSHAGGGIASVAADTTPQVGGSAGLDLQAQLLVGNGGTTGIAISANGEVTMAAQPAAYVYNANTRTDVTGDNTVYTLEFNGELFDQGGDLASNVFTAPVTGRYYARVRVAAGAVDTNQASGNLKIVSTLNTFGVWTIAPNDIIDSNESTLHYEDAFFPMTAGNTVYATFAVNSGSKDVNVNGGIGTTDFGIWLVA